MARPEKNSVDYFPFICKEGKAMYFIEERYGNDGFATWIKILRQLAVTNYHYISLKDDAELMFLAAKCRITESMLVNIISDLCRMGEFDVELWTEGRVIWNQKLVDSIQDAYSKRNNKCMDLPGLRVYLLSIGVLKGDGNSVKGDGNTQSKVEYSKVKEIKVKESKEDESIISEVLDYLNSRCLTNYRTTSEKNCKLIRFRLNEGFTSDDFKYVIDVKVNEWLGTDMEKYLRPETLFGTKFENYRNQKMNNYGTKQQQQQQPTISSVEQKKNNLRHMDGRSTEFVEKITGSEFFRDQE